MNYEDSNQQHIVPMQFAELRELQKIKKNELRVVLLKEYCHFLPEELWDIILSMVFSEDDDKAYFTFTRKDEIYVDDHYIFAGTEKDWLLAIKHMRSTVNPNDAQDDIPTDTYCSGLCILLNKSCPDEHGNQCACRWKHHVFKKQAHYIRYSEFWNMPGRSFKSFAVGKTGLLKSLSYYPNR
jgi:hypothetical protein